MTKPVRIIQNTHTLFSISISNFISPLSIPVLVSFYLIERKGFKRKGFWFYYYFPIMAGAWVRKTIVEKMSQVAMGLTPEDLDLNFLSGKGELRNLGKIDRLNLFVCLSISAFFASLTCHFLLLDILDYRQSSTVNIFKTMRPYHHIFD